VNIYDEIRNLENLSSIASALVKYAVSLEPRIEFELKNKRWVPSNSKNFVTFEFHWKRTLNIRISLRGYPEEHCHLQELEIKGGMTGYSECTVNSEKHLMPATIAIWRAHQLFIKGSKRERKKLTLTDGIDLPNTNSTDLSTMGWLRPRPKNPVSMWCGTPYINDLEHWSREITEFSSKNDLIIIDTNG